MIATRVARTAGEVAVALAMCLIAALLATAADAQSLPQTHRVRLDNGLTLLFRQNPAAQTVAIAAFVRAPASCETAQTAGIRSLVQGMLLHRPPGPEATGPVQQLAEYGAVIATSVQADCTEVMVAGLAEYFDRCLPALREILFGPEFDWQQLATERSAQMQLLKATQESGVAYASYLAHARLFAGTPCAWPAAGTRRSLERLRQADVRRLYERYWRPNNVVLAVCGPMEFQQCRRQVEAVFGNVLPGADARQEELRLADREPIYIHRPWPTDNAVVLMLCRAPRPGEEKYAPAQVLAAVLGGGQGSLLWQALREDQALVYGVEANVTTSNICSALQIAATCDAVRAGEVYGIIRDQISALRSAPPRQEQVDRAVSYLTGSYLLSQQSNLHAANLMGMFEIVGPGPELQANILEQIKGVSPAQVQQAAASCMKPAMWVQVGGAPPGY